MHVKIYKHKKMYSHVSSYTGLTVNDENLSN